MVKKVLTIAGSDCSGGDGIQADIKTITAHKMYAMSTETVLTAQNTTGIFGIYEASPAFIGQQLDCIWSDIRPDAVKIGMLPNRAIIELVAEKLAEYHAENIVIDPMNVAAFGGKRPLEGTAETLFTRLFPLGAVITPNIPEAEALSGIDILSGRNIFTQQNILRAARIISERVKCPILIKGGHLECTADDLLYIGGTAHWFTSERVDNPNTHGIGSAHSSAIACGLADGLSLPDSIKHAKAYVTGALKAGLKLGSGRGPLDLMWNIRLD